MKNIIKRHPYKFSLLLYTLLFITAYILYAGNSPYMYSEQSDIVDQFLPAIRELRRFYLDLLDGRFSIINYKALFGTEVLFAGGMPLNPFNFILVFLKGENIVYYFKIYYTVSMYLAGIAFMAMCREFKMNPGVSAPAALLYVFAPYTYAWAICYASPFNIVTAPLMIAGMERIFKKKRGTLLFAVSAVCVLTGGFYMYVFEVLVTVIYAFVKLFFIKEDSFFKRLWYYGSRGALAALGGFVLTAGAALPQLAAILSSGRVSAVKESVLEQALTLETEILSMVFTRNTEEYFLGTVIAPLVIVFFILKKAPAINKILLGLCLLGIVFPLFSAALCAFTYVEHRWVFGFTIAGAYAAGYVAENIRNADLSDRIWAAGGLIIYMLSMDYMMARAATPAFIVYIILMNIPPLRKHLDRFLNVINEKQQYILEVIVYLLLIMFTAVLTVIYNAPESIAVMIEIYAIITISFIEREKCRVKYILSFFSAAAMCISILRVVPMVQTLNKENLHNFDHLDVLNEIQKNDNALGDEIVRFESIDDFAQYNVSYTHNIALPDIFTNLIPSTYINMISEAEFDFNVYGSVNIVHGFEHRLPFMSVWGIDYIHTEPELQMCEYLRNLPGTVDFVKNFTVGEYENFVYKNNYSLPFGFTYDSVISNEERCLKNGADYSINMMYSAAVNEKDLNGDNVISSVSFEVPFDITSEIFRYDEYGDITYTKYTITPTEPITDSEVYITINGIDPYSNNYGTFSIRPNGDATSKLTGEFGGKIIDRTYHWFAARNNYTVCISTVDSLEYLEIIASCDFDDMRLTAFPVSDYIKQYEKLSEYALENVVLGDDEITGNITLPDDRMLCLQLIYSSGWQAYDNGKRVDIVCINDCMTGIRLSEGEHNIRLVYHVPGLREGMAVSCVTAVILIAAAVVYRKRTVKKSAD